MLRTPALICRIGPQWCGGDGGSCGGGGTQEVTTIDGQYGRHKRNILGQGNAIRYGVAQSRGAGVEGLREIYSKRDGKNLIRWGYVDRMDVEGRKIFEISIYSFNHYTYCI
jgi:hypothetical protein